MKVSATVRVMRDVTRTFWCYKTNMTIKCFQLNRNCSLLIFIITPVSLILMVCPSLENKPTLTTHSCLHRSLNALTTLKRPRQPMFSWQRNATVYRIKTDTLHFLTYGIASFSSSGFDIYQFRTEHQTVSAWRENHRQLISGQVWRWDLHSAGKYLK